MYQMISLILSGALAFSASAYIGQTDMPAQGKGETDALETMEQTEDMEMDTICITAGGQVFTATLYGNETAKAFVEQVPLTAMMEELNGNEKYVYLDESLPTEALNPGRIHKGDIMLYGSNCLVVFYKDFSTSYSYTPIGSITDAEGLAATLGKGEVSVSFALWE